MMGAVAQEVEKRADAPPQMTPAQIATAAIEEQMPRFQMVLPEGLTQERFTNLVVAAVKRSPDLIKCFRTESGRVSLLISAIQCAAVGLEPNTPLKEAVLLPRKYKGNDEAQLIIEYRGLIKLARRSGEISTLIAEVVYERDEFSYALGDSPFINHVPYDGDDDPGELRYCYAVVTFKDGGKQSVVVPRRVVYSDHRSKSDSWRNAREWSPWTVFEAKMWRKTAVKELEPFLPLTAEARAVLDSDDRRVTIADGVIVPAAEPPDVLEPPPNVDAETGEIIDGEVVEPESDNGGGDSTTDVASDADPAPSDDDQADALFVEQAGGTGRKLRDQPQA